MKPFEAHVKQWTIVHKRAIEPGRRRPEVKWVQVILQVPTASWRVAHSIGARLSRHMEKPLGRSVTVGEALGDAASERDTAYEYLHRWQEWSAKLHHRATFEFRSDTEKRAWIDGLFNAWGSEAPCEYGWSDPEGQGPEDVDSIEVEMVEANDGQG